MPFSSTIAGGPTWRFYSSVVGALKCRAGVRGGAWGRGAAGLRARHLGRACLVPLLFCLSRRRFYRCLCLSRRPVEAVAAVETDDCLWTVTRHAEFAVPTMRALGRCLHENPTNWR